MITQEGLAQALALLDEIVDKLLIEEPCQGPLPDTCTIHAARHSGEFPAVTDDRGRCPHKRAHILLIEMGVRR